MSLTNKSVYDYVMKNASKITEKWFSLKDGEAGSIYSKKSSSTVENLLRKQHAFTIETAISVFLDDEAAFSKNLSKWASEVAKSRVDLGTPAHEVLQALSITRQTIWEMIEQFIIEKNNFSTKLLLQWSSIFQLAFDQLSNEFASMYHEYTKKRFKEQQKLINELSLPVIPINGHIGVLPLIGAFDTFRAKLVLENVPLRCKEEAIYHLFIDLSGVSSIDTFVLHELTKLTKILHLIGIKSTLSGLCPEMAQMINALGIKLEEVATYSTLKQALSNLGLDIT